MKSLRLLAAAFLVLALGGPAAALGKGDKGTSGAQFLKLSPSPRAAGMGDAFSGVADDIHAVYYNPAGLGFLKQVEAAAMHNTHFQEISHNFGAVSVPVLAWTDSREERNAWGVMAFSITSLSVEDIERRGVTETDAPDGTFEASDFAYTLAYGLPLSDRLSLGLGAKFIDLNLDNTSGSAAAADAGVLYKTGNVTVGAGLRNLGNKIKLGSQSDPLPMLGYVGAGYRPVEGLLLAADARVPRDNSLGLSLGGEYRKSFSEDLSASLRAGFNSSNRDADGLTGVSFGAGLGFRNMGFDFAWVPFGDLGNTFRYSLTAKF